MHTEHINILSCPVSGERLCLDNAVYADDGHIESGKLISSTSTYPIINGIPRFVFDQSGTEKQTVQAFGDQWHECDESVFSYGQNKEYFSAYLYPLDPKAFDNSTLLDAGCGNGRLVEYALRFNPKLIVGIDYSRSVELAFNRTRHYKNVLIVQGSLLVPPLAQSSFDIIYSLGVVHHLQKPEKGLYQLGRLVAENGKIHIWTYSKEGNRLYLLLVSPLRWLAGKLPSRALWLLSSFLALITWPYLWLCKYITNKSSKNYLPMQGYLNFIYEYGFYIYKVAIHDQLVPAIVFYPSKDDIHRWANCAELQIFHMDMRTNNSWRVGLRRFKSSHKAMYRSEIKNETQNEI